MNETATAPGMNETTFKDPVCGMTVKPDSPHRYTYHDTEYHFCSAKCVAKFEADPEHYIEAAKPTDPVCGMKVDPARAREKGESSTTARTGCRAAR